MNIRDKSSYRFQSRINQFSQSRRDALFNLLTAVFFSLKIFLLSEKNTIVSLQNYCNSMFSDSCFITKFIAFNKFLPFRSFDNSNYYHMQFYYLVIKCYLLIDSFMLFLCKSN